MKGTLLALLVAIPIGIIIWFELTYLAFGITGAPTGGMASLFAAVAAFGLALSWPLLGTGQPADVVRRACRLGIVAAVLLPVVAWAVLLIWRNNPARPDPGAGGLLLNTAPMAALVGGAVLAVVFWLGQAAAKRRMASQRKGSPD